MKKIGRLFSVIIVLLLTVFIADSTYASPNVEEFECLSDMTDSECITFLEENGVVIPYGLSNEINWAALARGVIAEVEQNPNFSIPCEYAALNNFVNDIMCAVNEYYGLCNVSICAETEETEEIELRDSEPTTLIWDESYKEYNCYLYAINYYETGEPQDPGFLCGNDFSMNDSASQIADLVVLDLQTLGYTVRKTTTMPQTVITEHTHLICVRKDLDGIWYDVGGYYILLKDYHFMKLASDGSWYHKPGQTIPLRYLHIPSNDRNWINEGRIEKNFQHEFWTYDSEIYYIEYITPHSYEYAAGPNGTHTKTCTICNASEVLSCDLHTEYSGSGAHVTTCTYCDRLDFASCTGVLTHYEDEALGDAHKLSCRDCGNDMGGTGGHVPLSMYLLAPLMM